LRTAVEIIDVSVHIILSVSSRLINNKIMLTSLDNTKIRKYMSKMSKSMRRECTKIYTSIAEYSSHDEPFGHFGHFGHTKSSFTMRR